MTVPAVLAGAKYIVCTLCSVELTPATYDEHDSSEGHRKNVKAFKLGKAIEKVVRPCPGPLFPSVIVSGTTLLLG